MPRFVSQNDGMDSHRIGGSNFTFNGARIEDLGATEYTLVTIAVDVTGSTEAFAADLKNALITAVEACKKSPRSDNLLLRVILFSNYSKIGGVMELHGFKPLSEVDLASYPDFDPYGNTPLYDATYSSIGAMVEYGSKLMDSDFLANAIAFIITDGDDNASTTTPHMIKQQLDSVRQAEKLESLVSVLIGINAAKHKAYLENFQKEAGLDQYIDAGDATKGKLAKLAAFVSQSVSSQSQALGTGGPSQQISATI